MEVIDKNIGQLFNSEFIDLLLHENKVKNLKLNFELNNYFSQHFKFRFDNGSSVIDLLSFLDNFKTLTKFEKLMIVNYLPVSTIDLYVLIEEIEDRLNDDELDSILSYIQQLKSNQIQFNGIGNVNDDGNNAPPLFNDDDNDDYNEDEEYEKQQQQQYELEQAQIGEDEARDIDEVDE